tara:strand:+ start:336 stop:779 length:444 start_codon:yes stop_codon:yes gene_type:complete
MEKNVQMKLLFENWREYLNETINKDINIVVKAIIYNDKNEFLILINNDFKKWDLPGGHIQEEEDLIAGLKREIKEETDLDIGMPKKLAYKYGDRMHFFKVKMPDQEINLSKEHSDYELITSKEIDKLSKKFQPAAKEVAEQWKTSEQ